MTYVAPPSSFTTGMMQVEKHSFTWTIENFPVIRDFKTMIEAQKIYFSAGGEVGRPSKWCVHLKKENDEEYIGVYLTVEEPAASDPSWKNVFAEMKFDVDQFMFVRFKENTGPKEVATLPSTGVGYDHFVSSESPRSKLVIKHTFKLYVPSKSTEIRQPTVDELQLNFATQAKKMFALLLQNPASVKNIKIISNDQKEFFTQRGILEVQSPVLKAMIKNDKLEANSGVIKFPDISSKGLDVILTFLSTGELHPDWSETKVVVELTNAAGKYQLQELLKFLDTSLGSVCKVENALPLFTLARQHSLKKAEAELLKFINEKGSSSPEIYSKTLNGISVPTGSAFVVSSPSEKSRWTLIRPFRRFFGKNGKKNE